MSIVKYENVEILRKEHVVLKSVNLIIEPGQFTYIIGKVGSGKSSLLKSMMPKFPSRAVRQRCSNTISPHLSASRYRC